MKGSVVPCGGKLGTGEWALNIHEAAPTHNGKAKPKGTDDEVHYHFDTAKRPMDLKDWL